MERQTELRGQAKQAYASPRLSPVGHLTALTAAGSGTDAEARGRSCFRDSNSLPCT